jgi:hypothetical protein
MDEIEARLAALELLILEWLALEPEGKRAQMEDAIAAGLPERGSPSRDADEHDVRRQALQILRDSRTRFDVFTAGVRIVPPKG